MSVRLVRTVRLTVGAGAAKPGPGIGQALGPLGLNMAEFCKQFNEETKDYVKDVPVPVQLKAYSNRTFKFTCKTPPTSWMLKQCAGIKKGASRPAHETAGKVHVKQIYEIARIKKRQKSMSRLNLNNICRIVMGSAQSMGIEVVGGRETEEGEPVWAPGIAEQLELDQAEGIFDLAPVEDDDEEEE